MFSIERVTKFSDDCVKAVKRKFSRRIIKDYSKYSFIDKMAGWPAKIEKSNIEEINAVLESGYEFDTEDSSGPIAIMNAISQGNFEDAQLLHRARILDSLNKQSIKPSSFPDSINLVDWRLLELPLIEDFVSKLKKHGFNSDQTGEILAKVTNCIVCDIVWFKDPIMTKAFLLSVNWPKVGVRRAFEIIMPSFDVQHINAFLLDMPESNFNIHTFCNTFMANLSNYQKTKAGRDFIKTTFSWDIFGEDTLEYFEDALREPTYTSAQNFKVFLKYDFHLKIKAKYGRDLLASMFGNRNPAVSLLLKNEMIDVDGRGCGNNTPLHFAAQIPMLSRIKFLLNKGANPNILNDDNDTPLSVVVLKCRGDIDEHCVKALLLGGANPFLINNIIPKGNCLFYESWFLHMYMDFFKLLTAQAVIIEESGLPIEDPVRPYLDLRDRELELFYKDCSKQVNDLKRIKIRDVGGNRVTNSNELTIFTILAESPEKIAHLLAESDLQVIATFLNSANLNLYYKDLLKTRVENIVEINLRRMRVITVICEVTGISDPYHVVVHNILNYFTAKDLAMYSTKYKDPEAHLAVGKYYLRRAIRSDYLSWIYRFVDVDAHLGHH